MQLCASGRLNRMTVTAPRFSQATSVQAKSPRGAGGNRRSFSGCRSYFFNPT
jgi:hypothetical protein